MDLRETILDAADRLFQERGYKGITMDVLAAHVGISKKTLYQHFENKNDLVEAVRQRSHDAYHAAFNEISAASANAVEAFVKVTEMLYSISRRTNPAALYEMERFFPYAYESFRGELLVESVQISKGNLERGVAEGLYRPEIDVDMLANFRVETILLGMRDGTLMFDAGFSLEQISRETTEHFLYGLLTPAGLDIYNKLRQASTAA